MDWRDWLVVALVGAVIAYVAYRVGEYRGGGAQARLVNNSLWHVWAFAWFMYEGAGEPYGHNESGVRRYAREQIEAEYGPPRPTPLPRPSSALLRTCSRIEPGDIMIEPKPPTRDADWELLPGYPPDRSAGGYPRPVANPRLKDRG